MIDSDPVTALRAADPVRDEDVRAVLDGLARRGFGPPPPSVAARPPARRSGRRRRLFAAGLAATLAGAALVAPGGRGGADRADAAVLRRALVAMTAPAGSVLHVRQEHRQGGSVIIIESWETTSGRGRRMSRTWQRPCPTPEELSEEVSSGRLTFQAWDPFRRQVLREIEPGHTTGPVSSSDPTRQYARLLRSGRARVVGRTVVDGRPAIRIQGPRELGPDDPSARRDELVVDARTGRPLRYEWGGGLHDGTGGFRASIRFTTFEFLPAGPTVPLNVQEAHPKAPVRPTTQAAQQALYDARHRECPSLPAG